MGHLGNGTEARRAGGVSPPSERERVGGVERELGGLTPPARPTRTAS